MRGLFFVGIDGDVRRLAIDDYLVISGRRRNRLAVFIRGRHVIGRDDGIILARLVNLHRLAVEVGIGEVVGRTPKINQREIELLGVLVNAGAAPDDLLEFRHGADGTVEHDEAAGLGIHAGREQTRRRHEDGILCFRVDEVPELRLALGVASRDAHDVAVILVAQVFVLVDQGLPHARGMFFIHAKDDGLLEAVAALLQEVGDLLGDELGAVVDDERAVEVLRVVDAVFDFVAVAVRLAPLRPVAFDIDVDMDLDDLVRRKEAVLDALLERVGVNRLPEIMNVGDVLGFLRRGREPDLGRAREVFENLAPGGIVGGAATMTLVDDDQVKKARREFPEELLAFLRPGDGLIEAEIDLVGGVDAALSCRARSVSSTSEPS